MTPIDPRSVVAAKRDGHEVDPAQLRAFIGGFASGEIGIEIVAAFLMAVYLRGMSAKETTALTEALVASGRTITFEHVSHPTVDKHSTGGVGDGVTLVLAPLVASLGLAVAKISGRGLGHTGGTIDKLESIPGVRTDLDPDAIEEQVERVGCAIARQGPGVVPADGALYALRDATATVESTPLIASSVMAKKLAVRTDLVLLDVKAGSGAFMRSVDEASALAQRCVEIGRRAQRRVHATVTDMSQPLGSAIGNALEVAEAVAVLTGGERSRLRELVVGFAADAAMTLLDVDSMTAMRLAETALDDGTAAERFRAMVIAQGGDGRVVDDPWGILPRAPVVVGVPSGRQGSLTSVDAAALGRASARLGAGRVRADDEIDPSVGIVFGVRIGDRLERESPVATVHARDATAAEEACRAVVAAIEVSDDAAEPPPLVHARYD
ncbi:MAG: thymidine phosphorylase [Actinomycetota bacterium]